MNQNEIKRQPMSVQQVFAELEIVIPRVGFWVVKEGSGDKEKPLSSHAGYSIKEMIPAILFTADYLKEKTTVSENVYFDHSGAILGYDPEKDDFFVERSQYEAAGTAALKIAKEAMSEYREAQREKERQEQKLTLNNFIRRIRNNFGF